MSANPTQPAGNDLPPYVLIMASAGSGKTYTLTLRFVRILRNALLAGSESAAEKILATTFTRAAAGEIVDRVLTTLADAVHTAVTPAEVAEVAKARKELGLP